MPRKKLVYCIKQLWSRVRLPAGRELEEAERTFFSSLTTPRFPRTWLALPEARTKRNRCLSGPANLSLIKYHCCLASTRPAVETRDKEPSERREKVEWSQGHNRARAADTVAISPASSPATIQLRARPLSRPQPLYHRRA